jgi:acetyl esterase/lipase
MRFARFKWWLLSAAFIALAAGVVSCGGVAFTVANAPALVGDFDREASIAYGEDPRQRLDVYRPDGANSQPIVVFFYGGGWTKGDKANYRFVGATLAEAGYVTVLPDYRLYPDVRFPTFVEDGAVAVAWAVKNAARIGGDPRRVFLAGHSAGAHTAAMLALDTKFLRDAGVDPQVIRGWIGLSGPHVLTPDTPALRSMFGAPYTEKDWRPIAFASRAAPPTLLIHGTDDRIVWAQHSEQLAAALRAAGTDVKLELLEGRNHAAPVAGLSGPGRRSAPTLALMREFIDARSGPSH